MIPIKERVEDVFDKDIDSFSDSFHQFDTRGKFDLRKIHQILAIILEYLEEKEDEETAKDAVRV